MPQQTIPNIDFDHFVIGEIADLFDKGKIYINKSYQRGDIWKPRQKVQLIKSIDERYSMGVLVYYSSMTKTSMRSLTDNNAY